jgi:hypothetical protein
LTVRYRARRELRITVGARSPQPGP